MFICAFGFYMFIRVSKTLGLGGYFWYGCLVLAVEVLGATTTLIYGAPRAVHSCSAAAPNVCAAQASKLCA